MIGEHNIGNIKIKGRGLDSPTRRKTMSNTKNATNILSGQTAQDWYNGASHRLHEHSLDTAKSEWLIRNGYLRNNGEGSFNRSFIVGSTGAPEGDAALPGGLNTGDVVVYFDYGVDGAPNVPAPVLVQFIWDKAEGVRSTGF